MDKYNGEADHICPQCNGTTFYLMYVDGRHNYDLGLEPAIREAMKLTCKTCNYSWYEYISYLRNCDTY
jgi:hypothetical protein